MDSILEVSEETLRGCEWQWTDRIVRFAIIYIYARQKSQSLANLRWLIKSIQPAWTKALARGLGLWPAVWDATITGAVDHKMVQNNISQIIDLLVGSVCRAQLVSYSRAIFGKDDRSRDKSWYNAPLEWV